LREQFDFASEVQAVKDSEKPYWRLRGPNQWPSEYSLPGSREAFAYYHDEVEKLSYRFVHLIEEAFGVRTGTFDLFFQPARASLHSGDALNGSGGYAQTKPLRPQHRITLVWARAS